MTPQERDQLTSFLQQLVEARVNDKDQEADSLIRETVARQPDSAYLLVQRAMLVEQALNAAKAQIGQLQSRLQSQRAGGRNSGFLGGSNPWAQSQDDPTTPAAVPGAGNYQIPRGAPVANAAPLSGGAGSFLGNIATTAAGVVAGSFLFQGLENLLGHHHSSPSLWGDASGERPIEQTVVNNYYDTPESGDAANSGNRRDGDEVGDFLAGDDSDDFLDGSDDSDWV